MVAVVSLALAAACEPDAAKDKAKEVGEQAKDRAKEVGEQLADGAKDKAGELADGAVDRGRLVDMIGDGTQPGQADQHDEGRPHPGVDDDDRPRRQADIADHGKG